MAKTREVYKCDICGNIVEVLNAGVGELVCCNQPMKLQEEHTRDQGLEKHVPVVEETAEGIKVTIGSVPHPMEKEHWIQWVEVISGEDVFIKFLNPDEKPEAEFPIKKWDKVREYCNLHGLWIVKS